MWSGGSPTSHDETGNSGPALRQRRYDDLAARQQGYVATQGDVDRVAQAPDRAGALVELRHLDLDHVEVPAAELLDDAHGSPGRHHDGAADHDRVRAERRQGLGV